MEMGTIVEKKLIRLLYATFLLGDTIDKFKRLTTKILDDNKQQQIIDTIKNLDSSDNIANLIDLLAVS